MWSVPASSLCKAPARLPQSIPDPISMQWCRDNRTPCSRKSVQGVEMQTSDEKPRMSTSCTIHRMEVEGRIGSACNADGKRDREAERSRGDGGNRASTSDEVRGQQGLHGCRNLSLPAHTHTSIPTACVFKYCKQLLQSVLDCQCTELAPLFPTCYIMNALQTSA